MSKNREYRHQIFNESGYVLLYPNVGHEDKLIQSYPPNPYAESLTQQFPLGTGLRQAEREWVYCKNGAAALSTLGTAIQQAAAVHAEQDDDIVVGAASAIGDYTVSLTSTDNLDGSPNDETDSFKEGYLIVNDEAGEGQMYKIKSNTAFDASETVVVFTLYDPLTVALTTSTQVGLVHNPFDRVIATTAVVSGIFIGVNLIAVTASYYFWAQCKGPAPANMNAACPLGSPVAVGTTAAKFDPYSATATTQLWVGQLMTPGVAATEKAIVFLK